MGMTITEIEAWQARPENANRTAILCYQDGDDFLAEWDGREVRAGNPFGLDSKLNEIFAPVPRNLFLVDGKRPGS